MKRKEQSQERKYEIVKTNLSCASCLPFLVDPIVWKEGLWNEELCLFLAVVMSKSPRDLADLRSDLETLFHL